MSKASTGSTAPQAAIGAGSALAELRVVFAPDSKAERALPVERLGQVSSLQGAGVLHGASGLARARGGQLFAVTDRPVDRGHNVFAGPNPVTDARPNWDAWHALSVSGAPQCTTNLESIRVAASGELWVASDTTYVGRGTLEPDASGRIARIEFACSAALDPEQFPRTDDNAGFEALSFIEGRPYVMTEKAIAEHEATTRHRLFRVDFPKLVPVAELVIAGGADRHIRITDATACGARAYWLGTYVLGGERGYFLLEAELTAERLATGMRSEVTFRPLENTGIDGAGPPNLEGVLAEPDCQSLLLINDDSAGDRVSYPQTLVLRVRLP